MEGSGPEEEEKEFTSNQGNAHSIHLSCLIEKVFSDYSDESFGGSMVLNEVGEAYLPSSAMFAREGVTIGAQPVAGGLRHNPARGIKGILLRCRVSRLAWFFAVSASVELILILELIGILEFDQGIGSHYPSRGRMESSTLLAFNVPERPKQNSRGKAFTRASIWRSAYRQRRVYELDFANRSSLILAKKGNRSPFPTGEDGKVRPIGREGVGTLLVSLEKGSEVEREAGALAALSKESKGLLASVFLPQVLPMLPGYKISYGRRASRIIHHPQQLEQAPQWLG
ncbi:hypothetical protein L1987_45935 [Smallanthus sonchifolius]|uniref:Uncharacterized protein n=1 Tax=Smallanthus sonchifolius TaxID=185202 RepID=A0ACB9FZC6_9ASTR|nr:hypothetical protein L1987_45935 [Smallanthus sonchifolius]